MFNPICLKSTPFALYLALGALGTSSLVACGSDEQPLPPQATLLDSASPSVSTASAKPSSSTPPAGTSKVPVGGVMSNLATSCTNDAECGAGLFCLGPDSKDFLGGGPAGGYCTAKCKSGADCTKLEPNSTCTKLNDSVSICMLRCTAGNDDTSGTKCQGRADLACDANPAFTSPLCRPVCGEDADCGGSGRRCALDVGVCVQDSVKPDPVGKGCTSGTECEGGLCLKSSDEPVGFCSGYCSFVSVAACGVADTAALKPGQPACLYPATNSAAPGDLGYCAQSCACDGDCASQDHKCLLDPALAKVFGVPGFCASASMKPSDLDPGTTLGKACPGVPDAGVSDADASPEVLMSIDSGDRSVVSSEPGASTSLPASASAGPSAATATSASVTPIASATPSVSASVTTSGAATTSSSSATTAASATAAPSTTPTAGATASSSATATPSAS